MISAVDLCRILEGGRFDLSDEKACQSEIETWLTKHLPEGVVWAREVRLSARDRPDFLIGGVVVEVKMHSAQPPAVVRQLTRYAEHPAVDALILLSNRAIVLPPTIDDKPLFNVSLGRAWL